MQQVIEDLPASYMEPSVWTRSILITILSHVIPWCNTQISYGTVDFSGVENTGSCGAGTVLLSLRAECDLRNVRLCIYKNQTLELDLVE